MRGDMTIGELVGTDLKVKLGAKGGSSFIYCGNMKEFDPEEMDRLIVTAYKRTLKNTNKIIRGLKNKDRSYEAYEKEMASKRRRSMQMYKNDPLKLSEAVKKYSPSEIGYKKWGGDIERRLEYNKQARRRLNALTKRHAPISTRKIIEMYKSIDEADTVIVIYDGAERGIAWTTAEGKKGISEGISEEE